MPNVFTPRADLILRALALTIGAGAVGATGSLFALGRARVEPRMGRAPSQPVMFSHEHHVGRLGLDCRYCHSTAGVSDFAGMPTAETCMHCHHELYTTAPMLEPVREAWRTGEPIRWRRVYNTPDFVMFSHRVHVNSGVSCVSCHGRLDEQPLTRQATPMTMGWCLDCHREPHESLVHPADAHDPAAQPGEAQSPRTIGRTELLTNCSACHY